MSDDLADAAPSPDERVFAEPWEGRAFALATALHARGVFAWPDFQQRLVEEIEAWNATHSIDAPYSYYRLWLQALEGLIAERGVCALDSLDAIVAAGVLKDNRPRVVDPGTGEAAEPIVFAGLRDDSPPGMMLLACPFTNPDGTRTVAFVDGRIEHIPEDDYQTKAAGQR